MRTEYRGWGPLKYKGRWEKMREPERSRRNTKRGHLEYLRRAHSVEGMDQQEGQAKKEKSSLHFPTRKVLGMSTSAFAMVLNCNSYIQNEPERFHCF